MRILSISEKLESYESRQTVSSPKQKSQKSIPKQLAWCFLSTNSKWSYLLVWWLEWWLARAECACAALWWWCWGGSVCGCAFISVEFSFRTLSSCNTFKFISVVDPHPNPDPPDPHVFGPPGSGSESTSQRNGSGSGSFCHKAKIVRKKPLDLYCFVTSFVHFIIEKYVNVPSKSKKQKNFMKKTLFFGLLKVNDENSRIWISIRIN